MSQLNNNLDAWYHEATAYFRNLGFFSEVADLEGEALANWVRQRVIMTWDVPILPEAARDSQLADMVLLTVDQSRVWMHDLEFVYEGEQAYETTLREWSAISRGAFRPEGIHEIWHEGSSQAEVMFTVQGKSFGFEHDRGDIFDMRIIRDVNRSITTDMQFVVCDNFGMPNFVTALTSGERGKLEQERNWRFWNGWMSGL